MLKTKIKIALAVAALLGVHMSSAAIEIQSAGFVAPEINGKSNIPNPANGEIVFDSSDGAFWGYDGSVWNQFGGTANLSISTPSSAYTLVGSDDVVLAEASTSAYTLTLPAAGSNTGKLFTIQRTDDNPSNIITVDANGSETIGGALTKLLIAQNDSLQIVSDGSNWRVINEVDDIRARYTSTSGQSISNSGETIDYETEVYDTTSSVTTGSSWKFTAPKSGVYHVSAMVHYSGAAGTYTEGGSIDLELYKNGSFDRRIGFIRIGDTGSQSQWVAGVTEITLTAGDYIHIESDHGESADRPLTSDSGYNSVEIRKVK